MLARIAIAANWMSTRSCISLFDQRAAELAAAEQGVEAERQHADHGDQRTASSYERG